MYFFLFSVKDVSDILTSPDGVYYCKPNTLIEQSPIVMHNFVRQLLKLNSEIL